MTIPPGTPDPNLHWDGSRWLRWNGQQWVDAASGRPIGPSGEPGVAAGQSVQPAQPPQSMPAIQTAQPMPGYPAAPPPQKSGKGGMIAALVIVCVLGIAAVAGVVFLVFSSGDSGPTASGSPSPTSSPDNGIAALSVDQILSRTQQAALGQSSVHILSEGVQDGQPIKIDIVVTKSPDQSGTLTRGSSTMQYRVDSQYLWLKMDAASWQSSGRLSATQVQAIGDRWVRLPVASASTMLGDLGSYDSAIKSVITPKGTPTKGEQTTVDGQPAIVLFDASRGSKLFVATTGDPLPIKTTTDPAQATPSSTQSSSSGTAVFTQWGTAKPSAPPSAGETISMEELQKIVG